MKLSHVTLAGQNRLQDIYIDADKIIRVADADTALQQDDRGCRLLFGEAIAFPGLVNSHDHLDFNLFPQLGNRMYQDYKEWGADIHQRYRETIAAVLNIPQRLRARWGLYKNLLAGVTTVVQHGFLPEVQEDIIAVCRGGRPFHSISGEKGWRLKLLHPLKKQPIVIHAGEGTSPGTFEEINELINWNIFNRQLIGIHGVAMNEQQAACFRALVWCPASNYFMLGKTAAINLLKHKTKVLFGTDSTLSASWNIWQHLRLAREQRMTSDIELFDMLTRVPAELWGLRDSGSIEAGKQADIVVARKNDIAGGWDAFYALNPGDILLVLHKGNIALFDDSLHGQLVNARYPLHDFYKVCIGSDGKYVRGDLPGLLKEIRTYYPSVHFPVHSPR